MPACVSGGKFKINLDYGAEMSTMGVAEVVTWFDCHML